MGIHMKIEMYPNNQMSTELKSMINENSNHQYQNIRFQCYTNRVGSRVLYVFIDGYDASDAKANYVADACSTNPIVREMYDAVIVHFSDLNTFVEHYGEYKITSCFTSVSYT